MATRKVAKVDSEREADIITDGVVMFLHARGGGWHAVVPQAAQMVDLKDAMMSPAFTSFAAALMAAYIRYPSIFGLGQETDEED